MSAFSWPRPAWLDALPVDQREAALTRFHLCIAAIYADERMTAGKLARLVGMSDSGFGKVKQRGRVEADLAVKLEDLLGRTMFPRELFRPDLFTLPQE